MAITEAKKKYLKEYRQRRKDHIRVVSRARYMRNRERANQVVREWRKKNGDRPWSKFSEQRKKDIGIRRDTCQKYPLKGKTCEFCENPAVQHHHNTKPMHIDKFWYVCKICHNKIHFPEVNGELIISAEKLKSLPFKDSKEKI